MENVLVIGNGFDLAHNLPTTYNDFFFFMKNREGVFSKLKEYEAGKTIDEPWSRYFPNQRIELDDDSVQRMLDKLDNNVWVHYFLNCGADINGWIDFENEIKPALLFWSRVFDCNVSILPKDGGYKGRVEVNETWIGRQARLWEPEFMDYVAKNDTKFDLSSKYVERQYGIVKESIIKKLQDDWNSFIEAFSIYLIEFVEKRQPELLKQISQLNPTTIISFNYTFSEKYYISGQNTGCFHIHGVTEAKNIVMGIDDEEGISDDFMFFKKYFQRLQKCTPIQYKRLLESGNGEIGILSFYGHSLDITDTDIIVPLINNSRLVQIFYYSDLDRDRKLINLLKQFDKEVIENRIYHQTLLFVPIKGEKGVF